MKHPSVAAIRLAAFWVENYEPQDDANDAERELPAVAAWLNAYADRREQEVEFQAAAKAAGLDARTTRMARSIVKAKLAGRRA